MTYDLEPLPATATPSDYLRLQFDPTNVPGKRIVGLLACQRTSLELSTGPDRAVHSTRNGVSAPRCPRPPPQQDPCRLLRPSAVSAAIARRADNTGDPLLQSLTTYIHSIRPAAITAVPSQKGKGQKKKDKSAPASGATTPLTGGTSGTQTPTGNDTGPSAPEGRLWEVELDDTVIFPEGTSNTSLHARV